MCTQNQNYPSKAFWRWQHPPLLKKKKKQQLENPWVRSENLRKKRLILQRKWGDVNMIPADPGIPPNELNASDLRCSGHRGVLKAQMEEPEMTAQCLKYEIKKYLLHGDFHSGCKNWLSLWPVYTAQT